MSDKLNINGTIFDNVAALKVRLADSADFVDLVNTADASAVAYDIFEGKTAYINGRKVTGTFVILTEVKESGVDFTNSDTFVINKSSNVHGMSQVIIDKPENLTPHNIRHGINIAGIQGVFDNSDTIASVELCYYMQADTDVYFLVMVPCQVENLQIIVGREGDPESEEGETLEIVSDLDY